MGREMSDDEKDRLRAAVEAQRKHEERLAKEAKEAAERIKKDMR